MTKDLGGNNHDWYDTFGDTRCRNCDVLVWDAAAGEPCPGDIMPEQKPFYWYPEPRPIAEDPVYRGAVALSRFLFPGYVVPRLEMARAVIAAVEDTGDDWLDRLPPRTKAAGDPLIYPVDPPETGDARVPRSSDPKPEQGE